MKALSVTRNSAAFIEQGSMAFQQLSNDELNEANGSRVLNPSVRVESLEENGVSNYIGAQITGNQEMHEAAAPLLPNSDTTHYASNNMNRANMTHDNSHPQTISPDVFRSMGEPDAPTSASVLNTKKDPAKSSFNPRWYTSHNLYSDSTLYNKVGCSQMEAFHAGEGVDIIENFGSRKYPRYLENGSKRVKINKGQAMIEMVQVVHQRVIDRQKAGFEVGPNQAPNLGAEDWEAQTSAFDRANGPAAAVVNPGSVVKPSRKQNVSARTKGNNQALATEAPNQEPQETNNVDTASGILSAMAPNVPVVPGPQSLTGTNVPYYIWSEAAFVQRLDQLRNDLKVIKTTIMSKSEMVVKPVENTETASAAHNLKNDKAAQNAQEKTTELDQRIRDSRGELVISIEAQELIRRIIDAAIRFRDIKRRFEERDGNKDRLFKEGRYANDEYQGARSDLMQMLATATLWERIIKRGGYRVANIILKVFPAKPLDMFK
ncbi:hypothetical protein PMIN04_000722 [Paraphaeosphaeria minitans]